MTRAWLSLSVVGLAVFSGCGSPPLTHGIANLQPVSVERKIYRGGQPCSTDGWQYLWALGVRRVIKLNTDSEGSDAEGTAIGMRVVYVPITLKQQVIGPVAPQLWLALTNVTEGTFIHCEHGVNRTGTLVILWQVQSNHMSKANAVAEAKALGWDTSFHALKDFVEDQVR